VPTVVLAVEGGYSTLLTAFKAIDTETPVLVLAGSGRAADFIAKAYEKHETATNLAKKTTSKTNFKWYSSCLCIFCLSSTAHFLNLQHLQILISLDHTKLLNSLSLKYFH